MALDLGAIRTPLYIQAAKEDHIAPYASAFKLTNLAQGPTRFVLAGSGHIADAVNPPSANKYQHWRNDSGKRYERAEDWLAEATERPGSWCPDWSEWLAPHSGLQVPSQKTGRWRPVTDRGCTRLLRPEKELERGEAADRLAGIPQTRGDAVDRAKDRVEE